MSTETLDLQVPSAAAQQALAASTGTTQVTTNYPGWPANTGLVTLPQSGNLQLTYGYSTVPAQSIYIWHQGGTTTPISLGTAVYAVGQGDFIIYILPADNVSIKVAWFYQ